MAETKQKTQQTKQKRKYTKLTDEQKHEIYLLKARHGYNYHRIAQQYGTTSQTIHKAYIEQIPLPEEQEQQYLRQLENIRLEDYTSRAEELWQNLQHPVQPDWTQYANNLTARAHAYKTWIESIKDVTEQRIKLLARLESLSKTRQRLNQLDEFVVKHTIIDEREKAMVEQMILDAQQYMNENGGASVDS